jgi:DNA-binding transcriptional ArsR family regulator
MARLTVTQPKALFYPTKNKREVLQTLAEHFVLRSRDLAAVLRKREPNQNDIRTINRTLKILDDAGLVRRLHYLDLATNGVAFACGLSDAGVRYTGAGKTFDEHSVRTIDHELGISDFHRNLQSYCDAKGLPLTWKQSDLQHGVNPDAYFTIEKPGKILHFFLEIERAKIGNYKNGQPSIVRKLKHYYDYYYTPECENRWGFKTYRVVVIVPTQSRRDTLLKAMHSELEHRMFWLGVEETLEFRTPKDDTLSFADL